MGVLGWDEGGRIFDCYSLSTARGFFAMCTSECVLGTTCAPLLRSTRGFLTFVYFGFCFEFIYTVGLSVMYKLL